MRIVKPGAMTFHGTCGFCACEVADITLDEIERRWSVMDGWQFFITCPSCDRRIEATPDRETLFDSDEDQDAR